MLWRLPRWLCLGLHRHNRQSPTWDPYYIPHGSCSGTSLMPCIEHLMEMKPESFLIPLAGRVMERHCLVTLQFIPPGEHADGQLQRPTWVLWGSGLMVASRDGCLQLLKPQWACVTKLFQICHLQMAYVLINSMYPLPYHKRRGSTWQSSVSRVLAQCTGRFGSHTGRMCAKFYWVVETAFSEMDGEPERGDGVGRWASPGIRPPSGQTLLWLPLAERPLSSRHPSSSLFLCHVFPLSFALVPTFNHLCVCLLRSRGGPKVNFWVAKTEMPVLI